MSKRTGVARTSAQWAAIAISTKERLADAPPRSLRALVELNLSAIEVRIQRGWTIAQVVRDLDEAGIKTTVAVLKNTLYRVRRKVIGQGASGRHSCSKDQVSRATSNCSQSGSSGVPIFRALAGKSKDHF